MDKVLDPEQGRQKRVQVQNLANNQELTFYRTGKSVSSKAGQFKLLPVVPWVVARLGASARVSFDWSWRYA